MGGKEQGQKHWKEEEVLATSALEVMAYAMASRLKRDHEKAVPSTPVSRMHIGSAPGIHKRKT